MVALDVAKSKEFLTDPLPTRFTPPRCGYLRNFPRAQITDFSLDLCLS